MASPAKNPNFIISLGWVPGLGIIFKIPLVILKCWLSQMPWCYRSKTEVQECISSLGPFPQLKTSLNHSKWTASWRPCVKKEIPDFSLDGQVGMYSMVPRIRIEPLSQPRTKLSCHSQDLPGYEWATFNRSCTFGLVRRQCPDVWDCVLSAIQSSV